MLKVIKLTLKLLKIIKKLFCKGSEKYIHDYF